MPVSHEERQALIDSLVPWLESERAALVANLSEQGISLTRRVRRIFAERQFVFKQEGENKKGFWSLDKTVEDEVEVSRFWRRDKWLPMRWRGSTRSPISPSPPQPSTDFKVGDKVVVSESDDWFAESMLAEYLSALKTAAEPDERLARSIIADYLDWLFGDSVLFVEELFCGGILPDGEVVSAPEYGLELRRLSGEELGQFFERSFPPAGADDDFNFDFAQNFLQQFAPSSTTGLPPEITVASGLTLRRKTTKNDAITGPIQITRVVLAIQLMGFTVSGRGVVRKWVERGPNRDNFPEAIVVPQMPEFEERTMSAKDLSRAYDLATRIPLNFSDPHRREEVALHQFSTGASQLNDAEAVIAFMISLEALLVPADLQGENSYRFRLNGARFISDDATERREIYADLKRLYHVRSRLVHGAPPSKDDLREAKKKARVLAARALVKALTNGWPTGRDFEEAALS